MERSFQIKGQEGRHNFPKNSGSLGRGLKAGEGVAIFDNSGNCIAVFEFVRSNSANSIRVRTGALRSLGIKHVCALTPVSQ